MRPRDPRELLSLHETMRTLRPERKSRGRIIALWLLALGLAASISFALISGALPTEMRLASMRENMAAAAASVPSLMDGAVSSLYRALCPYMTDCEVAQTAQVVAPPQERVRPLAQQPTPLATDKRNAATTVSTDSASSPQTTVVKQYITQPIVERIIQSPPFASGLVLGASADWTTAKLSDLQDQIDALAHAPQQVFVPSFSGPAQTTPVNTATFAQSQRIDELSGTSLSNITVNGVSGLTAADIPALSYLPLSGGIVTGDLTVNGSFSGGSFSLSIAPTTNLVATNATTTNATSTNFFATTASSTNLFATNANITVLSLGSLNLTSPLSVSSGGTSWASLAAGYIPFGNGSSALATSSSLFWDNSAGRLGIGTTSPSSLLEVGNSTNGGVTANITNGGSNTLAYAEMSIRNGYTAANNADALRLMTFGTGYTTVGGFMQDGAAIEAGLNLTGGLSLITRNASGPMRFYTGGLVDANERMRITSGGNVGIGTTTPYNLLTLYKAGATAANSPQMVFSASSTVSGLGNFISNWTVGVDNLDGGKFKISSSSVIGTNDRFVIDGNGNVGIGDASPQAKLDIVSSGITSLSGDVRIKEFNGDIAYLEARDDENAGDIDMQIRTQNAGNFQNVMKLTKDGNVGIGTTTPWARLSVTNTGTGPSFIVEDSASPDVSPFLIDATGNVGIGTTNPGALLTVSGTASTTNLTVSALNAASCDVKSSAAGVLSCGTDATGSVTWPWTIGTNYAVAVNSTTTPTHFVNGMMASSTSYFVYASTTAFSVSGATALATTTISNAIIAKGPYVDVLAYGAKNDGTGDNGPAFIAAAQSLSLTKGGTILVPPGTYNFDTSFDIPQFRDGAIVTIEMSGALLTTNDAISIFQRVPTDQMNALQIIGAIFRIHGGVFQGTNLSGQIGVQLGATYGSQIDGVYFKSLDIGFDGAFDLDLRITNARSFNNSTVDFKLETGVGNWSGASVSNSQSNHTTIEGVRVYGAVGATANFMILGSSGVSIRNSIVEGQNPTNAIYFDDQNSTVTKTFTVENLHCENTPTNAIISMNGTGGGVYTFDTIYTAAVTTFLDVTGLGVSTLNIKNIPYVNNFTTAFKHGSTAGALNGTMWNFENWGGGNKQITDTSWWESGAVPNNLFNISREITGSGVQLEGPRIFIGDPNTTDPNAGHGIRIMGGLFFTTDDTFDIGSYGSYLWRPHSITVGTGGLTTYGNVGIGTTAPGARLSVAGASNGSTPLFTISTSTASATSTAFIIDRNGNVGIGTTTPSTALTVNGSITPSTSTVFTLGNATYLWNAVYATNGTIQTSDARLKDNVASTTYGLDQVMQLHPVSYVWKAHPEQGTRLGFIAQEVQPILPETVNVGDDANHTLGLTYTEFIPVIVRAIQQLAAKVSDLATTVGSFADHFTTRNLSFVRAEGDYIGAREVSAHDRLCVGSTCITETQLAALLSQSPAAAPTVPAPAASSTAPGPATPPTPAATTSPETSDAATSSPAVIESAPTVTEPTTPIADSPSLVPEEEPEPEAGAPTVLDTAGSTEPAP